MVEIQEVIMLKQFLIEHDIDGFDKDGGTDKNTEHSYCDYYQRLFDEINNRSLDKFNVLEIGTFKGGWAYSILSHIKNSNLICLDIDNRFSQNLLEKIDKNRIKLIQQNAYDSELIAEFITNKIEFDLIMEDGPHTLETQIFAVTEYTKLLSQNGLLIIEDIQSTDCLNTLISRITQEFTFNIVDLRSIKNRWDDLILEIRRK
jgi:predicted O-methyltransferase YrrM